MEPRLVTEEMDVSADWKCARIHWSEENRYWKYGAAARNMFLIEKQLDSIPQHDKERLPSP